MKTFDGRSRKTILLYISIVGDLFLKLIELEPFYQHHRFKQLPLFVDKKRIYSVIDTIFLPICKLRGDSECYYSTKHKTYGIKYEVVCGIKDGHINWISENYYPGSTADITIALDGLIDDYELKNKEKILADKYYSGEDIFITPITHDLLTKHQKATEKRLLPYYQTIKNIFSEIKECNILKTI